MNKILKYSILLLPILIVVDIKIPLTETITIGFKELIFGILTLFLLRKKTIVFFFSKKIVFLFLLFVVFTVFNNGILNNLTPDIILYLMRLVEGILLFTCIYFFLKKNAITSLYSAIFVACIILSGQIYFTFIFGLEVDSTLGGIKGIYLAFASLILFFEWKQVMFFNWLKISLLILFLTACYISEGRTWFLLVFLIMGLHYISQFSIKKGILTAIFLVICLLSFNEIEKILLKNEMTKEIYHAATETDITEVQNLNSRFTRWENVSEDIAQNWFLGVGYGKIDLNLASWVNAELPDNIYLQLWLENGLLGLLTFIGILFTGIGIRMNNSKSTTRLIRYQFLFYIIGGITWGYMTGYGILVFSILIGIAAANKLPQFYKTIREQ